MSNLSETVDEWHLRELFGHLGQVDSIQLIMNEVTGRSEKFAFINMPVKEEAEIAVRCLNNMRFMGGYLEVKELHTSAHS